MFELVLRAPQALVEAVSDALADDLEALSVSVEDADADGDDERALFGEPGLPPPAAGWRRSTLKALFDDEAAADRACAWLLARHAEGGLLLQALAVLPDHDWVRLTQQQFPPVDLGDGFWVVPSWHAVPAGARTVLRLDPGLAFGTGTHPTTRMCLRWLARTAAAGDGVAGGGRVLDYGCGSGILAIAARLLGAREGCVDAVDIDPAALRASADNAARNGVALAPGPPERAHGRYRVVLANILATPLKLLAPLLAAHVAPGGHLVLAGILARQAGALTAAYAAAGLALAVADDDEGWVLMTARRADAVPPPGAA